MHVWSYFQITGRRTEERRKDETHKKRNDTFNKIYLLLYYRFSNVSVSLVLLSKIAVAEHWYGFVNLTMLLLSIKGFAQKEDLYLLVMCPFSCVLLLALNLFATSVQNEVLYTGNEAISAQKVFVYFISLKHINLVCIILAIVYKMWNILLNEYMSRFPADVLQHKDESITCITI